MRTTIACDHQPFSFVRNAPVGNAGRSVQHFACNCPVERLEILSLTRLWRWYASVESRGWGFHDGPRKRDA